MKQGESEPGRVSKDSTNEKSSLDPPERTHSQGLGIILCLPLKFHLSPGDTADPCLTKPAHQALLLAEHTAPQSCQAVFLTCLVILFNFTATQGLTDCSMFIPFQINLKPEASILLISPTCQYCSISSSPGAFANEESSSRAPGLAGRDQPCWV